MVKKDPFGLHSSLKRLPKGETSYYRIRQQNPKLLSPVEAAARFIYLNRFCFNGLFRTNSRGLFNVPYGGGRSGDLPTKAELSAISTMLQGVTFRTGDFQRVLESTVSTDFVYLDPPFAVGNRRIFKQYGPETFGLEDLRRLATSIDAMDRRGISFVLSYAYCKEALELFYKWPKRKVFVRRNIAGFAKSRRTSAELLISNTF